MEGKQKIGLLHKWSLWTVIMPYYTDSFEAYLMLNRFSRASRRELINNFKAFRNSMKGYRRDVFIKDEINECLIDDWLDKAKQYPLMLLRLNFYVNRPGALTAIAEFEQWFSGVERLDPPTYTGDFEVVDCGYLCTDYEIGEISVNFETMLTSTQNDGAIYKHAPKFSKHIALKWADLKEYFEGRKMISTIPLDNHYYKADQTRRLFIIKALERVGKIDTVEEFDDTQLGFNYLRSSSKLFKSNEKVLTECGVEIDCLKQFTTSSSFLEMLEPNSKFNFFEADLQNGMFRSGLENLQFLKLKQIKLDIRIPRGVIGRGKFDFLWHLNDNIDVDYKYYGGYTGDFYELKFKFASFKLVSFPHESHQKCLAQSVAVKLDLSEINDVKFDEKYAYIQKFNELHIKGMRKDLEDNDVAISDTLFSTTNEENFREEGVKFMLILPKVNLAEYRSIFLAQKYLQRDNEEIKNVIDIINNCYEPFVRVEPYKHTVEECKELIELLPGRTRFELECTVINNGYMPKISLFTSSKVSSLTEHMSVSSFACDSEGAQMLAQAIKTTWQDCLEEFQITLAEEELIVPLLDALADHHRLRRLRIQYHITEYFINESEEITKWLESHPRFSANLEKFTRTPILD